MNTTQETPWTGTGPHPRRRHVAPWFIVEGLLLIALGVVAAVLPGLAGIAGALVFGWVLIMSGIFGLVALFGARDHTHMLWGVLSAVVAIAVGALVIWRPVAGAVAIAIFIAAYLFIDAIAMVGLAMDQRRRHGHGWPWLIVSGVIDLVLAVLILALGPLSDSVFLGVIIAVDLIIGGVALVTLGFGARRAPAA
jgi:uncharacterized membrane protein HdeD (DUF308 family)